MAAERGMVRFGGTTIEYEVRRSERRKKTVQVTVDGAGVSGRGTRNHAGQRVAGHSS